MLTNAYGEGGWVDLKFIIAYECIYMVYMDWWYSKFGKLKEVYRGGCVGLVNSLAYELCEQHLVY